MNLTTTEQLMYEVMNAIYDSGIPISFKGSMILRVCLLEAGYIEQIRHTVDIDGNWSSEKHLSENQMAYSLQTAINRKGIDLCVGVFRKYGIGCSAGFDFFDKNTGEKMFSMDIDVDRDISSTRLYQINGMRFIGVSPVQMMTDKVCAVSTYRVFRRIKDMVDLYYLSKVFSIDKNEIIQTCRQTGRVIGNFSEFNTKIDELRHSYEKFRFSGDVSKPLFDEIYKTVKDYLNEFLM